MQTLKREGSQNGNNISKEEKEQGVKLGRLGGEKKKEHDRFVFVRAMSIDRETG